MFLYILGIFLYFIFIQCFFVYKTSLGDSVKGKLSEVASQYGSLEIVKNDVTIPTWEYNFIDALEFTINIFSSKNIEIDIDRNYSESPKKFIFYTSFFITIIKMIFMPFKVIRDEG